VIVLLARDSRVETVLHLSESIRSALTQVRPGIVVHVGA
jgi:hypothetical protein